MRALRSRAPQAARQVHVHDVEASGAEPEVDRGGVHDDVVADRARADEPEVGDRGAARAVDLDLHPLLGRIGRPGLHDGATAERQHRPGD